MPCDQNHLADILILPQATLNDIINSMSRDNVKSLCMSTNLQLINHSIRCHINSSSRTASINNELSSVSPNPENIQFLNDMHRQRQEQDDGEDSGFASGGIHCKLFSCMEDHEILISNERELSICGFYYPHLDSISAMKILKNSSIGTFLIRNSLDSRYLFSLSVKTQRGATSVRIAYEEGWFSFDCDERIRKQMPRFRSVLSLADHHVELSRQGINNSWRWEEKSGRKNMVVEISKPCRTSVPSLKHLCTVQVNKSLDKLHFILLRQPFENEKIINCIRNYPFKV